MPAKYFEIRWHSRAGQGGKSAAQLVAETVLEEGKHAQAFPEYGAERSGAPMRAFNRISEGRIRVHHSVESPDVVVVIDDTLLSPTIVSGLKEDGVLIVNTKHSFDFVRKKTNFNGKVCIVNATDIALQEIKRGVPNTVMIGTLARVTGLMNLEMVGKKIREMFERKLPEEMIQANIRALRRGYEEVQCSG
ncbi:MAG: Pyruvate ferredoxin oxidoreductase, gamma subunit [Thermotoga sp. 50_1627]|uniref:2-oxoacid:acceptor oxidoreductase family protein n=1 Tax=Pseudothermotoga sp. TaxID=2033661 RepID=UPI00076BED52|nr:MAG: Pyruvate ferredoxin oxidoreductase, gamma subunit [Thermotoga sp. 50_64]KUK25804.1 MAG: Pyruvate ferredoxin oxidoreductase, gamma subunit [Thermotoga sp. 50_1627]MBC7115489.1 2-oxoacid:acceptor oxidoreductase family protein [Pseudothermotoga sp.]MDK2922877.1 pyruvate ferredoxin oxidoreductase gamma subunit [Pseudothermotoga sp.]HBT40093.1 pyruvate synthase [Pseudothermotoga sp.]